MGAEPSDDGAVAVRGVAGGGARPLQHRGEATLASPVLDLEDYGATCAAVQNLLLAAHAEGLAAKWSTGEMAESGVARAHLGFGDADRIVALVYLGVAEASEAGLAAPKRGEPVVDWRE